MKKTPFLLIRAAALACCLAALVFSGVPPAHAVLKGSRHDFSTDTGPYSPNLGPNGLCSPCHIPHKAPDSSPSPTLLLWTRSLTEEQTYFTYDGSPSPNYVPDTTLLCYDCHDDNPTTGSPAVDNDPLTGSGTWASSHEPQNVAFTDDTLFQGGTKAGYYELVNGDVPGGPTTMPVPADQDPTGGHYWKTEPSGTPDYLQGDKIPCGLCHDPHVSTLRVSANEAFFLKTTRNGAGGTVTLGDPLKASTYDGALNPNGSRNGTGNGRKMCAACHGYAPPNNKSPAVRLYNVDVPFPPNSPTPVPEHLMPVNEDDPNATPCVVCHPHNRPVGCNECHAYPPLVALPFDRVTQPDGQSYTGGAGAHRRHLDALGSAIFSCDICHGPEPGRMSTTWHMEGGSTVVRGNVDIRGLSAYWGAGSSYNGTTGPPGVYAFAAKGGPDGANGGLCANLVCHGLPPDTPGALNWSDTMVDETPGPFPAGDFSGAEGVKICKWCHDRTPARIGDGTVPSVARAAPNVLGTDDGATGVWNTATNFWGADVSGHGKASGFYDGNQVGTPGTKPAADLECTVCHDARYTTNALPAANTPIARHFSDGNADNRLRDEINGQAAATTDAVCVVCHQNGATGAAQGTDVSTHSNTVTAGGFQDPAEAPQFSRACRQCHNVHGANWNGLSGAAPNLGRNLHMIGTWFDADNDGVADAVEEARVDSTAGDANTNIAADDARVLFTSSTGANSYDDGFGGGGENPAAHESVCAVCHADLASNHNEATSADVFGAGHNPTGTDCMQCHDHGYDNDATTADAFMPSGCNGCHGTNATEPLQNDPNAGNVPALRGQFWPDGLAVLSQYNYTDDKTGAHRKHVEAIALQVYGETAAEVVTDASAANPTLTASEKQKTICAFCHPSPGGPGHSANVGTDPELGRVNVYGGTAVGDWLRKYTPNDGPVPAATRATYADDIASPAPNGYNFTTQSCSGGAAPGQNLACHNQAPTPVAPNGWNAPPVWAASATCSTTSCHGTATYTRAHTAHVGTLQKNYACTECHADNATLVPATNPIPLGHGNGEVDMVFDVTVGITPTPLEAVKGGNGFYDKEPGGVASSGDTAFAYKIAPFNVTCNLIYCHGGDNAAIWGGGDVTPVWDNSAPDSVYCGSCHDGNGTAAPGGDASVIASGNHTDHLSAAYGPNFGNATCAPSAGAGAATNGCHTAFDVPAITPTHVNGSVEFDNIAGTPSSPLGVLAVAAGDATDTDRCSPCHSTASFTFNIAGPATETGAGAALAKTNWADGAYTLPCLSCHNAPATAGRNYADGTGRVAPDMLGDDLDNGYGAEIRGHNRSLAQSGAGPTIYPVSGNPVAALLCDDCHNAAATHINNADDTTYAGNRMLGTINGQGSTTTRTLACERCHATALTSPATKKTINTHGNNNGAYLEPATFLVADCMQCHDPHGMTRNAGGGYNIQMIAPTITVVPGTTAGVRFESLEDPGTHTFNDNDSPYTPGNDLCVVCHANTSNPGYTMSADEDGQHTSTPSYNSDERGTNCTNCHSHNKDNSLATPDGFMPFECNYCHTYPGLAIQADSHRLSTVHDVHVGAPAPGLLYYGNNIKCSACHYQSHHNTAGVTAPTEWDTKILDATAQGTNVQVRFDTRAWAAGGWNPNAGANPVDRKSDSPAYNETTNVCSNLYCHGADTTLFPSALGNNMTPDWDLASTGDCGTCHRAGAGAVAPNPTTPPQTLAHPTHAGSGADEYGITCQTCHAGTTNNGSTIASYGLHVNKAAEVSFSGLADLRVDGASVYNNAGDTSIGAPYFSCSGTYCHSPGTVRTAPYLAAPSQVLAWNQNGNCWSCHGDGAAISRPGYAEGAPKANKHRIHNALSTDTPPGNGYGCQVCHWSTTQTGNAIVSTTLHVNRSYDANDDGAGSSLDAFDSVTNSGSCGSANCHGGNSGISWGLAGPITCDLCHSYVNGALTAADANDFVWNGANQSKIGNAAGGQYETSGHGKTGVAQACADCHDSALPHDPTMIGANPYRLSGYAGDQSGFCNTTCHTVQVRTHDPAQMQAAGIAPKRTPWPAPWDTPATSPRCVNCHDPHGDGNLSMINRELYDKSAFQLGGASPAAPTEQLNLVFTNDATAPFIDSTVPYETYADAVVFSSICQECHEAANMVSFHDGTTALGANHPAVTTTDCGDCHRHDAGFAPSGCEGCHNGVTPYDPDGAGPQAAAPNVMGPGNNPDGTGTSPKPYDNGAWGYNVNGHGANGTAASTPAYTDPNNGSKTPYLTPNAKCTDCHDISLPSSGDGRHLNGILNSVDGKLNPSENTAHLRADTDCPPPFTGVCYSFISDAGGDGAANVQINFDRACWLNCHQKIPGFIDMRHRILQPGPTNVNTTPNASRFGDGGTYPDGESIVYPIDSALTTMAITAPDDFAPCITCHNPHGTPVVESTKNTNRMARDQFFDTKTLCLVCHPP